MFVKQEIGAYGEEKACNYLKNIGYKIIERNYKCKQGEIDIIGLDGKTNELVFFEVKTRTSKRYGLPKEAVDNIKQKHIYRSAEYYIYVHNIKNIPIRLDVIEVYLKKETFYIKHIKQAFEKRK